MLNGTEGCAHSHKARVSVGGQPAARSRQTAPSTYALTRGGSVQLQRYPLRIVNAVSTCVPQPSAPRKGACTAPTMANMPLSRPRMEKHVSTPRSLPRGSLPFQSKKCCLSRGGAACDAHSRPRSRGRARGQMGGNVDPISAHAVPFSRPARAKRSCGDRRKRPHRHPGHRPAGR